MSGNGVRIINGMNLPPFMWWLSKYQPRKKPSGMPMTFATISMICKSSGRRPMLAPTRKFPASRPMVDAKSDAQCTPKPAAPIIATSLYGT